VSRAARIAVCMLLAAGVAAVAIEAIGRGGHGFAGKCSLCHTSEKVEPGGKVTLKASSVIAHQCTLCHRRNSGASHPVGMAVASSLPPGFPLDETGRMMCLTCHAAHQPAGGVELPNFLRAGVAGQELCVQCHAGATALAKRDAHALAFSDAHSQKKVAAPVAAFGIDERSLACLSCHDDLSASSSGGGSFGERRLTSHPIGVVYPSSGGPASDFRSIGSLDPAITLFDGKLGCESCHNLFSNIDHYLVMSNKGSRLCLSCHNK